MKWVIPDRKKISVNMMRPARLIPGRSTTPSSLPGFVHGVSTVGGAAVVKVACRRAPRIQVDADCAERTDGSVLMSDSAPALGCPACSPDPFFLGFCRDVRDGRRRNAIQGSPLVGRIGAVFGFRVVANGDALGRVVLVLPFVVQPRFCGGGVSGWDDWHAVIGLALAIMSFHCCASTADVPDAAALSTRRGRHRASLQYLTCGDFCWK